jgi:lysophospholipase L1-like esterase
MIQRNDTIRFQGDSITDAGRNRDFTEANRGIALGHGYAFMVSGELGTTYPGLGLQCLNRGISDNRIVDLYARWRIDAINLKPDVISILIGANDTWMTFKRDNGVEVPRYEQVYRMLLEYTKENLPDVRLILCEPFYLLCGVVEPEWIPQMQGRSEAVRRLAGEFGAKFVPFQSMFDELAKQAAPEHGLWDGVHPTAAGHNAMAKLWLNMSCVPTKIWAAPGSLRRKRNPSGSDFR